MSPQASSTLPVGSASADSWDEVIDTRAGVPINELIDGLDDIAALAIPYARLPRRAYNVFSAQFASWSDIAGRVSPRRPVLHHPLIRHLRRKGLRPAGRCCSGWNRAP